MSGSGRIIGMSGSGKVIGVSGSGRVIGMFEILQTCASPRRLYQTGTFNSSRYIIQMVAAKG